MNWEMLAAVGQLAAVLVGIPSLIYLALQIRAQTKERRFSAVRPNGIPLDACWDIRREREQSPDQRL